MADESSIEQQAQQIEDKDIAETPMQEKPGQDEVETAVEVFI